jgi:hypothetical protein
MSWNVMVHCQTLKNASYVLVSFYPFFLVLLFLSMDLVDGFLLRGMGTTWGHLDVPSEINPCAYNLAQ